MATRNSTIDKDRFISLYKEGKSLHNIAKILGISYSMTRNRALEWNLTQDINYNKIDEKQLMELYGQGNSIKSIAKIINVPYWDVYHKFNSIDKCSNYSLTNDILEQILQMYKDGKPIETISEFSSLPKWIVRSQLQQQGVVFKPRRFTVDDDIFSTLTSATCYWGGMLAADGWVRNNCCVGLELQILDQENVKKFAKFVNYNGEVYFRPDRPMCSVNFISDKIASDLRKNFMIVPRKTKVLEPPIHLPDDLAKHFIRGYNDGDGGFCNTHPRVSIRGRQSVLEWFKTILQRNCIGIGNPKIFTDGSTHRLQFCGLKQFIKITDWIYSDSDENIRLDRKFTLAQEWKKGEKE